MLILIMSSTPPPPTDSLFASLNLKGPALTSPPALSCTVPKGEFESLLLGITLPTAGINFFRKEKRQLYSVSTRSDSKTFNSPHHGI
jgi:hypothetical protein